MTGRVPALEPNCEQGWPLVVMMGGINIAPDSYRWLAQRLVAEGMCVVTYSAIGSLGPAGYGITPGLDISALNPQNVGSRSCSTTLKPLLNRLAMADPTDCPVAGFLDLSQIVIGGHSAGGTVALHNSDPAWVPGLRGVFAYGSHTMVAVSLGHGEQTMLAVPSKVPIMLLGGAKDNVIAASQSRYAAKSDHNPIRRTFNEAIKGHQDTWIVELADLGHFGICWPIDHTSGRTFLESDAERDHATSRAFLGDLIAAFTVTSLSNKESSHFDEDVHCLDELVQNPLITYHQRR